MNLEFLDKVYREIFAGDIGYLVTISKLIGGLLIVISLSKNIFKNFAAKGKVFDGDKEDGFSPATVYRMFFLLALVVAIPSILTLFDSMCASVEKVITGNFHAAFPDYENITNVHLEVPSPNETATGSILRKLGLIADALNPMNWLGGAGSYVLEFILKIIDFLIYPAFLAQRYFVMGLIKIFAPLLVALSIYDKFRDYIYTIFKLYAIYFLVIIPYIFATVFVNQLHDGVLRMIYTQSVVGAATMMVAGGTIKVVAMLLVIVIKLKLYKAGLPFMKEIFK